MSYNIDSWRTKKIEELSVPMEAVHEFPKAEVHLRRDGTVVVSAFPEGFEITGTQDGARLAIDSLELWGVGSGHAWAHLKELLEQSTGHLEAVQVWEGGDSITRLTVTDGEVCEESVEI